MKKKFLFFLSLIPAFLLLFIPFLAGASHPSPETANQSLPILAALMGTLDGFNVCSIGALILIISLVFVFKSRKVILLAGGSFILATVITYAALIFLWHRLFTYILPYQFLFEGLLGLIALTGGLYLFKIFVDAVRFGPTCATQGSSIINWAASKVETKFKSNSYLAIPLGAAFFAIIVTIIEFPCSAALPLVFVGIVSAANTPFLVFSAYVLIYLFFYMLIEVVIFLIAVFTKKLWIGSPLMVTVSSFIASLILLIIAAHYLFGLPVPFL